MYISFSTHPIYFYNFSLSRIHWLSHFIHCLSSIVCHPLLTFYYKPFIISFRLALSTLSIFHFPSWVSHCPSTPLIFTIYYLLSIIHYPDSSFFQLRYHLALLHYSFSFTFNPISVIDREVPITHYPLCQTLANNYPIIACTYHCLNVRLSYS